MNPHYRLEALTRYPEWHNKPLRLTTAEIKNPWLVLEEFFDMYRLPNFRDSLKLWMDDTVRSETEDLSKHVHTCTMIEKLVEAAYLLYKEKQEEDEEFPENEQEIAGDDLNGLDEENAVYPEEERKQFVKKPLLGYETGRDPVKALARVFKTEELDTLKQTVDQWCKLALINERANYEKPSQREDLLTFCKGLAKLIEASYCIGRIHGIEERSGFSLSRPVSLQQDILRKEQSLSLSYEELLDPGQVVHLFWNQFNYAYSKAELWDMLDSAISVNNNEDKFFLLLYYQCLLTILEASWHLHLEKARAEEKKDL